MANRKVSEAGKDSDGDITSLCGDWGAVTKAEAIYDIECGTDCYYVQQPDTARVNVEVISGTAGKFLRTEADGDPRNPIL